MSSGRVTLPAPRDGRVDLLIVSAEHSGDEHAARMVRELRARRPGVSVAALGGKHLEAAGAQLLRDLTVSSALGFAVVRKISFYRALIAEIVRWVGEHQPRVVCFVDSSGLNLRIARGLFQRGFSAKAGGPTKTVYYISPQVWASRAKRRFQMAQHLDALAAIFPFERAVYADTSLRVDYVGHPFVAPDYVAPVRHDPEGPVLLLPGSRRGAVAKIFPDLIAGWRALGERDAVVLYPSDEIRAVLERVLARIGPLPRKLTLQRTGAVVGASAVLTSSGTMSMHCALAGIPGAIAYRIDWLTYFLGRLLVKVDYLGIANLLLREPMYPEFIQNAATPAALAAELRACLRDPARQARTREQAARLRAMLAVPTSGSPAEWIERFLSR